jgi:hypothetical protein
MFWQLAAVRATTAAAARKDFPERTELRLKMW